MDKGRYSLVYGWMDIVRYSLCMDGWMDIGGNNSLVYCCMKQFVTQVQSLT